MAAVPLFGFTGCHPESARWQFSQAMQLAENGDPEGALERMRLAVAKSGEHWELALPYAHELAKRGDQESLAICSRILKREDIQRSERLLEYARLTKVECQLQLGDFSGALTTLKTLYRDRVSHSAIEENRLAYVRALANTELNLAAVNIERAIQGIASDWCCGERLDIRSKSIVASALLSRYFLEESRQHPDIETIEAAKVRLRQARILLSDRIQSYEKEFGRIIECVESEKNALNLERCTAKNNLVVLLIVRALVSQDLGEMEECNRDRYQASRMSLNIEKVVQGLPDEKNCLNLLMFASAFLDTRGFVFTQLMASQVPTASPDFNEIYHQSLDDLNVAIFASEIEHRAMQGELFNHISHPVTHVRMLQTGTKRSAAVLRYHRMLTYQHGNNLEAAERDRRAIVELGFTPGKHLH